jgi:hypothetical protein
MDTTSLMIPRGNDVVVTARFPEIATGTGMSSQFWYKNDKTTPDSDPSVLMVQSTVVSDPDFRPDGSKQCSYRRILVESRRHRHQQQKANCQLRNTASRGGVVTHE